MKVMKKILASCLVIASLFISTTASATACTHSLRSEDTVVGSFSYNGHYYELTIGYTSDGSLLVVDQWCTIITTNYIQRIACTKCTYYYYIDAYSTRTHTGCGA